MKGYLIFHSETGTEGGWYAIQDEEFTHTVDEPCWDDKDGKLSQWCPARQHYEGYDTPMSGKHSSYDGLHYIGEGDYLKVWNEDRSCVVWEGVVEYDVDPPRFTKGVGPFWVNKWIPGGEIENEVWANMFFEELPAEWRRREPKA
jgi:hypothetical protein